MFVRRVRPHEEVHGDRRRLGLSVSRESEQALLVTCQDNASFANRVRRLAHAGHLGKVDFAAIRGALEKHEIPRDHSPTHTDIARTGQVHWSGRPRKREDPKHELPESRDASTPNGWRRVGSAVDGD